jgi:hypothetical protein
MSSTKKTIEKAADLLSFFRSELKSAFTETGFEANENTEAYLAHLLENFSRFDPDTNRDVGFSRPAAYLLCEAMNSPGERRMEAYRRLGDASLFNCGFFSEHLTRRTVSAEYYRNVGQVAYKNLGDLMAFKDSGGMFQQIYHELAGKFDGFVEVLRCLGRGSANTDRSKRVLEKLRSGESVSLDELRRAGLLAVEGEDKT